MSVVKPSFVAQALMGWHERRSRLTRRLSFFVFVVVFFLLAGYFISTWLGMTPPRTFSDKMILLAKLVTQFGVVWLHTIGMFVSYAYAFDLNTEIMQISRSPKIQKMH